VVDLGGQRTPAASPAALDLVRARPAAEGDTWSRGNQTIPVSRYHYHKEAGSTHRDGPPCAGACEPCNRHLSPGQRDGSQLAARCGSPTIAAAESYAVRSYS